MTSHIQINRYFICAGDFIKGLRIMKFHLNIKTCSLCTGYTEYYCHSCKKDLCLHCKAVHVIDLDTTHHTVTIYREKIQNLSIRHTCVMHNNKLYNKNLNLVKLLCVILALIIVISLEYPRFCRFLFQSKHTHLGIRAAYKTRRQYYSDKIHNIRSDTLYYRSVLLKRMTSDINIDIQICKSEMKRCQYEIILKSKALKNL